MSHKIHKNNNALLGVPIYLYLYILYFDDSNKVCHICATNVLDRERIVTCSKSIYKSLQLYSKYVMRHPLIL